LALNEPCHNGQDYQPDDVINNGGSQDDLALGFLKSPEIREYSGRDSNAGSRQAGSGNYCDDVAQSQEAADQIPQDKW
jgi:hypothetical protein